MVVISAGEQGEDGNTGVVSGKTKTEYVCYDR